MNWTFALPAPLRVATLCSLLCLSACSGISGLPYYAQAAKGHLELLHLARPFQEIIADPATPAALKDKLKMAQGVRQFASQVLQLPDNASYTRFADIRPRLAPVWNVVAAPELSLQLQEWCFPVAGCVKYKGFYDVKLATAFAEEIKIEQTQDALEINIYPVPAYSTLGYSNWLGGDPLLSSFINYPNGEIARLIFHELAHQQVYVQNDTAFNESFASAVEQLGVEQWLQQAADAKSRSDYEKWDARRKAFRALTKTTREQLDALYKKPQTMRFASAEAESAFRAEMREEKKRIMQRFRTDYEALKASPTWEGFKGYDRWVLNANNAAFGAQAAYEDYIPAFEALFLEQGKNWQAFYAAVAALAKLPKDERDAKLQDFAKPKS